MDYRKWMKDPNYPITEADHKFIKLHILDKCEEMNEEMKEKGAEQVTCTNYISGIKKKTNPLLATLTQMILELSFNNFNNASMKYWGVKQTNVTQKFDRARSIIRKLDGNFYMDIID